MSKPLVFITGASGHIGFAALALLLKKGYRARIASRKLAKAQKLKDLPTIKSYVDSIFFVEIPDFLAKNAFDEAVKDVGYIVRVASPIPDDSLVGQVFDIKETYIAPAIQGDVGVLEAAQKSPSVKRVIITSSVAVLSPKGGSTSVGPDNLAPLPKIEKIAQNPWIAYRASKILANAAAQEWVEKHNPHFEVVHILPSYVQGRHEPATLAQDLVDRISSNSTMINFVLGHEETQPRPSDLVLADDVAATHVAALESKDRVAGDRACGEEIVSQGSRERCLVSWWRATWVWVEV
ncbi:uncharacterized protein Z518_01002 [Rhinocladiella mackenziei CBS 650.93]|uniref:NAD-dependent epimerase/dehydratase domain-containing protein n=1 Tax=Rhinocladiella mackenziei CBS 650.93 TaxID=1442369 RepID=A0A0D2J2L4_9EURO|nr:uncharacterized protein Z518_01002 [Rhinocladiella mackenziei CBS 650.93]KIX09921.1 hypothetical protein Z518_01002 [Rhinocladiella mackenziei CBS 650.93]